MPILEDHPEPAPVDDGVPGGDGLTPSERQGLLSQVEAAGRAFSLVATVAPFLVYVGLVVWSTQAEFGRLVFTGYLAADFVSWALVGMFEMQERWVELLIQLGCYLIIVPVWLRADGPSISDNNGDFAIFGFVWLIVFIVKMANWAHHRYG